MHYIFDNEAENKITNFGNIGIGYRSMNGQYISIGPKKAISVDLYCIYSACNQVWNSV